jgi:hypothetical protein
MSDVKFVRIHGKVVPLKGKGSAPGGVSKRYGAKREKPRVKKVGAAEGALRVAGTMAGINLVSRAFTGRPVFSLGNLAAGAIAGAAVGSISTTRRGKGESYAQAARRASGAKARQK